MAGENWPYFLGNPWVPGGGGNIIGFEKFEHYSSKIDFYQIFSKFHGKRRALQHVPLYSYVH